MARTVSTDFLHSMRFQADITGAGPAATNFLGTGGNPGAGFSMISAPGMTVEVSPYKEGTFIYTRKYPGIPSMTDITLSRGITRTDSSFWDWLRRIVEGNGEYRGDMIIKHFHRDTALNRSVPATGTLNNTNIDVETPAKLYHLHDAFATSHKIGSDFDASSSNISIMELGVTYENFEITSGLAP